MHRDAAPAMGRDAHLFRVDYAPVIRRGQLPLAGTLSWPWFSQTSASNAMTVSERLASLLRSGLEASTTRSDVMAEPSTPSGSLC
jgi:hypothetical protein